MIFSLPWYYNIKAGDFLGFRVINGEAYPIGNFKLPNERLSENSNNKKINFNDILYDEIKKGHNQYTLSKHAADRIRRLNFTEKDMKVIEKGFKINASEYKKLQNQYLKQKKKRLSTLEVESVMRKYQNTLVYLIEIGCLENLKNFKKDFLERLVTRFKSIYTIKEIVYDVHTGHSIGCVTPSG